MDPGFCDRFKQPNNHRHGRHRSPVGAAGRAAPAYGSDRKPHVEIAGLAGATSLAGRLGTVY